MVDHASTRVALALKDFNLKRTELTNNNFFLGSFVCLWEADLLGIQNAYFYQGSSSGKYNS